MGLEVFGISYQGGGRHNRGQGTGSKVACLSALSASEAGLDGVVLVEFGLDVVIEGLQFFCKGVNEIGYGFVGAVLDFVPLEGAEVLVDGFCGSVVRLSSNNRVKSVLLTEHTVVDRLLLLDFSLVVGQDDCQRLSNLAHYVFCGRTELGQVIGLLNERIQGADLEGRYREWGGCA